MPKLRRLAANTWMRMGSPMIHGEVLKSLAEFSKKDMQNKKEMSETCEQIVRSTLNEQTAFFHDLKSRCEAWHTSVSDFQASIEKHIIDYVKVSIDNIKQSEEEASILMQTNTNVRNEAQKLIEQHQITPDEDFEDKIVLLSQKLNELDQKSAVALEENRKLCENNTAKKRLTELIRNMEGVKLRKYLEHNVLRSELCMDGQAATVVVSPDSDGNFNYVHGEASSQYSDQESDANTHSTSPKSTSSEKAKAKSGGKDDNNNNEDDGAFDDDDDEVKCGEEKYAKQFNSFLDNNSSSGSSNKSIKTPGIIGGVQNNKNLNNDAQAAWFSASSANWSESRDDMASNNAWNELALDTSRAIQETRSKTNPYCMSYTSNAGSWFDSAGGESKKAVGSSYSSESSGDNFCVSSASCDIFSSGNESVKLNAAADYQAHRSVPDAGAARKGRDNVFRDPAALENLNALALQLSRIESTGPSNGAVAAPMKNAYPEAPRPIEYQRFNSVGSRSEPLFKINDEPASPTFAAASIASNGPRSAVLCAPMDPYSRQGSSQWNTQDSFGGSRSMAANGHTSRSPALRNAAYCGGNGSGNNTCSVSPNFDMFGSDMSGAPRLASNGRPMQGLNIRSRFGTLGVATGELTNPHGFCLGMDEEIIVADTNNHRIQIFDRDGRVKHMFGTNGREDGQLWYPRKVAYLRRSNKIIVCDRGVERSRMQVFNSSGVFYKKHNISLPILLLVLQRREWVTLLLLTVFDQRASL